MQNCTSYIAYARRFGHTLRVLYLVSRAKPSVDIMDFGYSGPFRLVPKSLL